jgi:anti-anti-sigma regulatory factor
MLRITKKINGSSTLLRLEGALLEPWSDEIRRAVLEAQTIELPLKLDLADVTFVDQAGILLLREILGTGVKLVAASDFIAASLGMEKP